MEAWVLALAATQELRAELAVRLVQPRQQPVGLLAAWSALAALAFVREEAKRSMALAGLDVAGRLRLEADAGVAACGSRRPISAPRTLLALLLLLQQWARDEVPRGRLYAARGQRVPLPWTKTPS